MLKNYLKIALRNIKRTKIYSLINICGLAIGMACSILILLWVYDEISFDSFNENKQDIFRVISDWEKWEWDGLPISPEPLGPAILAGTPEVNDMFRILEYGRAAVKYNNSAFYENKGVIVDPSIFSMFTFPFAKGDPNTALSTPESIVISESFAGKYFGNLNPIGKDLEVDGKLRTVTGVYYDIPQNSHLQFDFVLNFEFIKDYSDYGTGWNAFNFTTYVQVGNSSNKNISLISDKITQIALDNESAQVKEGVKFRLQPLSDIHLYQFGWQPSYTVIGDQSQVYAFTLIAAFILLIACVNFINLSTAGAHTRMKEIGLRKTVGALKKQLIGQFLSEAIIIAFISIIFALVLVQLFIPEFNELTRKSISLDYIDPYFILGLVIILLFTGIIAGAYPAFYLSSFNPLSILKGGSSINQKNPAFRKLLVVFQFSLSIALIFITIIIYKQIDYSKNMKLGYNKDNLMYIPLIGDLQSKYFLLKNELLNNNLIEQVSAHRYNFISDPTPRAAGFKWEGMEENRERDLDLILSGIDYSFFEMLDINLVQGRAFSEEYSLDKEGVILNKAALAEMNLKDPVGKWISLGNWRKTIIGVAENVHFRSTKNEVKPRVYFLSDYTSASGIMIIKINGAETQKAISFVESLWNKNNSASPFEFGFIDEDYENLYKSESVLNLIFRYFTTIAIFISCLGLFGLSIYSAERRKKEVGIRKVLGASTTEIVTLFTKEFLKWVLLANIIAWPAAYLFTENWLNDFAYRIDVGITQFLLAGSIAIAIALITISYQAIKAAIANPVESLKYE